MKIGSQAVPAAALAVSSFNGAQPDLNADKDANQLAWQREMERAQMDGWLDHPLTGSTQAAPDLSELAAGQSERNAMLKFSAAAVRPAMFAAPSAMPAAGTASALANPALAADAGVIAERAATVTPGTSLVQRLTARIDSLLADDAAQGKPEQRPASLQAPVVAKPQSGQLSSESGPAAPRISIQWNGADATLWLGISANDGVSSAGLARIVAEARAMLAADGVRLQGVMCNGKALPVPGLEVDNAHEAHEAHDVSGSASGMEKTSAARSERGVPFYSYFATPQET